MRTESSPEKIDIRQFLHATDYLRSLYNFHKAKNPGFSYEAWSAELGYKSRSFLKLVASGKRKVTTEFIDNFSRRLQLSHFEKHYLSLIASYENGSSHEEKNLYLAKVFELRGEYKEKTMIDAHEEFLKSVHTPKIQVLLSFKDIQKSDENFARILNISLVEVQRSLQILSALGLAEQDSATSHWRASESSFKVIRKNGNEALIHYHNMCLQEAMDAQRLPGSVRRLKSLLLALNAPEFENLVVDIEQLINKAVSKYDHDEIKGRSLYKMNIQIFPTTSQVEE